MNSGMLNSVSVPSGGEIAALLQLAQLLSSDKATVERIAKFAAACEEARALISAAHKEKASLTKQRLENEVELTRLRKEHDAKLAEERAASEKAIEAAKADFQNCLAVFNEKMDSLMGIDAAHQQKAAELERRLEQLKAPL